MIPPIVWNKNKIPVPVPSSGWVREASGYKDGTTDPPTVSVEFEHEGVRYAVYLMQTRLGRPYIQDAVTLKWQEDEDFYGEPIGYYVEDQLCHEDEFILIEA